MEGAFKVAAVQTSPWFVYVRRTVAKACHFIREAATHGASDWPVLISGIATVDAAQSKGRPV